MDSDDTESVSATSGPGEDDEAEPGDEEGESSGESGDETQSYCDTDEDADEDVDEDANGDADEDADEDAVAGGYLVDGRGNRVHPEAFPDDKSFGGDAGRKSLPFGRGMRRAGSRYFKES